MQFVDAYAHGDFATASELASPLYGAEWARRERVAPDLAVQLPAPYAPGDNEGDWLDITFIGGGVDINGLSPGVWSYGVQEPNPVEYGKTIPPRVQLPPGFAELQRRYPNSLP